MRITKLGHACVRLEHEGQVVVLDPGGFTGPGATEGATAVLVTHEHADHLDLDQLRATEAPIWTIEAVRAKIAEADPAVAERVTVVAPGESFDVGVPVTAVGEQHAVIHPDIPRITNSGYLVDLAGTRVLHPGDSLGSVEKDVDVLLLPVSAPWAKVSEIIDFGRAVGAARSLAIHDAIYSEAGLGVVRTVVGGLVPGFERLEPGTDLPL
jgi:L-ascorbate metabolism protein UlaG (beta-lactamase superfamily)